MSVSLLNALSGIIFPLTLTAADTTSVFALVSQCGDTSADLCAHGYFKKGDPVTLLPLHGKKICKSKFNEQINYRPTEALGFQATRIDTRPCQNLKEGYSLAYLSSLTAFKNIELKEVTDSSTLSIIKTAAEQEKILGKMLEEANLKAKSKYTIADLNTDKAVFYTISSFSKKINVAHYPIIGNKNGPIYSHIEGKVLPLAIFCARTPKFFSVNDQIFAYIHQGCCECGWVAMSVFELKNDGFEQIYTNGDHSN